MGKGGQPRVLLVEDEPAQRTVLAYNLEAEGFAVTQADNGEDAMVLVDEAHSMGFIGPNGRGVAEDQGVLDDVDFVIGTFSKSVGTVGGFLTASKSATRTSSSQSRDCSIITSPYARSAPSRVFCRSENCTMAVRSVSSNVRRSSAYALVAVFSGSRK